MTLTSNLQQQPNLAPLASANSPEMPSMQTFSATAPFFVERHSWGEHRKANMSAVAIRDAEDEAATKRMLSLRKRLLDSETTRAIRLLDTRFRERLHELSATPFRPGIYLIPLGLVERCFDEAQQYERERDALADRAAEEFPNLIAPMRAQLGPLFNPDDYPSPQRFRACFWVNYRFIDMGVPNVLRSLRADVLARERRAIEDEARQVVDLVKQHLRGSLLDITDHLRTLLAPKANGRMPALRDGALDRLFEFLQTLELRDVTNDGALRTLAGRIRQQIDGISDVQDIRDDEALRQRMAASMEQAHRLLETMVEEGAPVRAYRLRDESEVA